MTRSPKKPGLLARIKNLSEQWKLAILVVTPLVLAGVRFETWQSNLARADDVAAARAESVALERRTAVVEASLADIKTSLRDISMQLVEIARTTGARQIVAPPSTQGPPP